MHCSVYSIERNIHQDLCYAWPGSRRCTWQYGVSKGFSGSSLLEDIEADMPEYSWRKYGFKQEMQRCLIGAAGVLDFEQEARRLKKASY